MLEGVMSLIAKFNEKTHRRINKPIQRQTKNDNNTIDAFLDNEWP